MSETAAFIRSPSYPSMSLREAVTAIAKIEGQYRSSPVDRLNAVKLLGFSSMSGPAGKALADLASYGLLERAGKGMARVSEKARDILHPISEERRKATLQSAASEPPLFRDIRERFAGVGVPPEDGVVTYLNRQGFNPRAVRPAAKAFLQTVSYLEELGASESDGTPLAPPDNAGAADGGGNVGPPPRAPISARKVPVMEGERIVFTEEAEPNQYLKLIASGTIDDGMLDALEDFVKRQRRRVNSALRRDRERWQVELAQCEASGLGNSSVAETIRGWVREADQILDDAP